MLRKANQPSEMDTLFILLTPSYPPTHPCDGGFFSETGSVEFICGGAGGVGSGGNSVQVLNCAWTWWNRSSAVERGSVMLGSQGQRFASDCWDFASRPISLSDQAGSQSSCSFVFSLSFICPFKHPKDKNIRHLLRLMNASFISHLCHLFTS